MTLVTISMSKWLWLQMDPTWVLEGFFIDFWWCDHSAAFVLVGADGFFGCCRFELWVKTRRYVDLCVNWDWNPLHPSAAWKMNEMNVKWILLKVSQIWFLVQTLNNDCQLEMALRKIRTGLTDEGMERWCTWVRGHLAQQHLASNCALGLVDFAENRCRAKRD